MLALQEAGLRVPEDVAMVGFDDVPLAALVRPGLTTLRINIADMGRTALERLVSFIESAGAADADVACEVVRPELVVRPSTDPANPNPTPEGRGSPAAAVPLPQGETP